MSGTPIKKRSIKNPGAARFNRIYSKRTPTKVESLSDQELLTILLGNPTAAASVLEEIGELGQFSRIGEGAGMMHRPGISKGTALKLDALFEIACRLG